MPDLPYLPNRGVGRFLRSRVGTTLALWVLLIAMFLAIWTVLPHGESPTAQDPAEPVGSFWTQTLWSLVPLLAIGSLFLLFLVRARGSMTTQMEGFKAQSDGDFVQAEAIFERLAKAYRWFKPMRQFANYHRAVARMHRGNLGGALDLLTDVDRTAPSTHVRVGVACHLALTYALRGDLDSARRWRAEGEDRLKRLPQPHLSAALTFVDAIVEAREGHPDAAIRQLDERWSELESGMSARALRPLRVLRAFALRQTANVREAGVVEAALKTIGPVGAGDLAMLAAEWPDMRAFLESNVKALPPP